MVDSIIIIETCFLYITLTHDTKRIAKAWCSEALDVFIDGMECVRRITSRRASSAQPVRHLGLSMLRFLYALEIYLAHSLDRKSAVLLDLSNVGNGMSIKMCIL